MKRKGLVAGLLILVLLTGAVPVRAISGSVPAAQGVPMPVPWPALPVFKIPGIEVTPPQIKEPPADDLDYIQQLRKGAGYLSAPWSDPVVQELVDRQIFSPAEIDDPAFSYYRLPFGIAYGQTSLVLWVVYQATPPSDDEAPGVPPGSNILKIGGYLLAGGATILVGSCLIPYFQPDEDPDERDKDIPEGRLTTCVRLIADATGRRDWAESIDRGVRISADFVMAVNWMAWASTSPRQFVVLVSPNNPRAAVFAGLFGKRIVDMDVPPQIRNKRLLVPLGILREVGLMVGWNGETKTATITRKGDWAWAKFTAGDPQYHTSNGDPRPLAVPPVIENGRMLVPLRAAFSTFCVVRWQRYVERAIMSCVA